MDIEDSMLENLKTADFAGFIKTGAEYSDAVIRAEEEMQGLNGLLDEIQVNKEINTIEKDENFLRFLLQSI